MNCRKEIIALRKEVASLRWVLYHAVVRNCSENESYREETFAFEEETEKLVNEKEGAQNEHAAEQAGTAV